MRPEPVLDLNTEAEVPPGQSSEVLRILEDYLAAIERGGRPDRAEMLARYPQHVEILEAYLNKLDLLHCAAVSLRHSSDGEELSGADGSPELEQLGDYQIVKQIGRGGMGIVYEAEQKSLGRRVALKVLPFAAALDARQLQRFKNEAQAAAHLDHPNIVPVYSVGTDRGIHYYVMQFIDGQNLATVIRDLRRLNGLPEVEDLSFVLDPKVFGGPSGSFAVAPAESPRPDGEPTGPYVTPKNGATSPPVTSTIVANFSTQHSTKTPAFFHMVATLGVQAAEALEHAHRMGVVHRDIKPANLLVDLRGSLWITDFGLARSQAGHELTMTGDLLGTLRYMSPEQVQAKRGIVDHRTDIYSLGVTLYELLTLQAAFTAQSRHDLLRQVAQDDPRPPRRINNAVPADLETIVLKAMAKAPEDRYGTAQDLADDVQRFLQEKPILAKRPSLRERAVKWTRRHRPVVISAASVLVVALLAGLVLTWRDREAEAARAIEAEEAQKGTEAALVQAKLERFEKERALGQVKEALEHARQQRRFARDVVNEMYTHVAENLLRDLPQQQALQREFLLKALAFFRKLATEEGSDADVRYEVAHAYIRVGDIQQRLGDLAKAKDAYASALPVLEKLVRELPSEPRYRELLAVLHNSTGILQNQTGSLAAAEASFSHAAAILEKLCEEAPKEPGFRHKLASHYDNLAGIRLNAGRFAAAEPLQLRALALRQGLVAQEPTNSEYWHHLGVTFLNTGVLYWHTGRNPEAEKAWLQARDVAEKLLVMRPNAREYRDLLSESLNNLGALYMTADRPAEAESNWRRCLEVNRRLVADFPSLPAYRRNLASACSNFGRLLRETDRLREAEAVYRESLSVLKVLTEAYPSVPDFQRLEAAAANDLAKLWQKCGRLKDAEQGFGQALGIMQKLVRAGVNLPLYRDEFSNYLNNVAHAYQEAGRLDDAERLYRESLLERAVLVDDIPSCPEYRERLAAGYENLGRLLQSMNRWDEAEQTFRTSLGIYALLSNALPRHHGYLHDVAAVHRRLGSLLRATGRATEARDEFRLALQYDERTLESAPNAPAICKEVAWALATCPEPEFRDPARAVDLALRATRLAPSAGESWAILGVAFCRKGDTAAAVTALTEAATLTPAKNSKASFALAIAHAQRGDQVEARKWFDQAIRELEENPSRDEDVVQLRAEAAARMLMGAIPLH